MILLPCGRVCSILAAKSRRNPQRSFRVVRGVWHQDADPPHLVRLLRSRAERPPPRRQEGW